MSDLMRQIRYWKELLSPYAIDGAELHPIAVRQLIGVLVGIEVEIRDLRQNSSAAPIIDITDYQVVRDAEARR